jgi:TPR repeat protein
MNQHDLFQKAKSYALNNQLSKAISTLDKPYNEFKAEAVFRLGELVALTEKTKISMSKRVDSTVRYWKKALAWGHNEAALELGQMYYQGKDVERDLVQAEAYWREGYEMKRDFYEMCGLRLINFYLEHKKDQIEQAIDICNKLLLQKTVQGICYYKLYLIHTLPIQGKQNLQKAMKYLQKGVNSEDPDCIFTTMNLSGT